MWLSKNGTCEIHLTCSVDNMNDNNLLRWEVAGNITIHEANLTLSWDPRESGEEEYTCVAENPVTKLSFSVSTWSLCKGNSLPWVSPRALNSCGVGCVPSAQGHFPKQGLRERTPNTAGRGLTPPAGPCLSLSPEASPPSLPPSPCSSSPLRAQGPSTWEVRTAPHTGSTRLPSGPPHGLPLPERLPRARAHLAPKGGLEEAQQRL